MPLLFPTLHRWEVHRQPNQTVCAGGSIGEGGAEVEGGDLAHFRPTPVLVQRGGEERHVE